MSMNSIESGLRFVPVQCTQEKFDTLIGTNGHVYFITDKKKIYIDKDGEMIPMCTSSGIFYGHKPIEYDNSGVLPPAEVRFGYDEIEGPEIGEVPEADDLILNVGTDDFPDGCFYRVITPAEDVIETKRLTLQGSGGGMGGGPGGGGDGTVTSNFSLSASNNQTAYYFSNNAKEAFIGIVGHSTDSSNYISKVECSFSNNIEDEEKKFLVHENLSYALDKEYPINLIAHLSKMNTSGSTSVYVHVTDKYGTSRYKKFTISIVTLQITTEEKTMLHTTDDTYEYRLTLGGSRDLNSYAVQFEFYNDNGVLVDEQEFPVEKNQLNAPVPCVLNMADIPHGAYTMKVYLSAVSGITTLASNIETHKMIRFQEGGEPILGVLIPDEMEQYTEIPINYLLVYGDSIKTYNLAIRLDEELITTQSVVSGSLDTYELNIDKKGVYYLEMEIEELSILQNYELVVKEYTGTLPVVNVDRSDLAVYLTPRGRTNNAVDKEFWPDTKNSDRKAKLTGFHFRTVDGWLKDTNNINYLKVSQGAQVVLDGYSPYSQSPNSKGLTIELDFKLSGVSNYNDSLIECLSLKADKSIYTGFKIAGEKFEYYVGGTVVSSLNLVHDKRIRISYVIDTVSNAKLCYTYLNGIVCGIYPIQTNDDFASFPDYPGYLNINSTAGQVDMYGVRFYTSPLNAQTILNNYQASLDTLEMRQKSYDLNQIRNIYGQIDLDIIESEDYEVTIPYAKIVGGYSMIKTDNGMVMAAAATNNVPALPTTKKDYRGIDISIHYPKYNAATGANEYFKNYKDMSITSKFGDSDATITNAFGLTMTEGAWMYGQGTSSMEYPVKNLRVKATGGHKFVVQPDKLNSEGKVTEVGVKPVDLICFKADFMESSGSHNTGAGNLIDNVIYKNTSLQTPGQKQFDDETIVTCIKGHPCIIFWSPTGAKGSFSFIGKYNLNLDKATPDPFGFKEDPDDPKFGFLTDESGNLEYGDDNKKINSIFCFEFLDNNERVCNFVHDQESEYIGYDVSDDPEKKYEINTLSEEERYKDTWDSLRINEDGDIVPGWARGFESRHPEDKIGVDDADALWPLAKWLNHLYAERYLRNNEGAVAEFTKNYWRYLDPDFTVAYYVITEALLMADSRVKNMMIATWGKEWRFHDANGNVYKTRPSKGSEVADDVELTGDNYHANYGYIWYPIFYDMDTMLGLDNIGYRSKNYYDEDTIEDVFNGDEILWKFVRDGLKTRVAEYYRYAEDQNALTKDAILPCFNNNQANLANETFYNEDAKYKYIDPYLSQHSGSRLFPAQGDRALDREFFITNRLKYLAGKYNTKDHQEFDRFFYRLTSPAYTENAEPGSREDKLNKSIAVVPPSDKFYLTSAKTCYAGVKVGTTLKSHKFIDIEENVELAVPSGGANGTEVYVTGISGLSSFGSLANKYPYGIDVFGMSDSPIKEFIIGDHNKDYYNPYLANETALDMSPLKYLETFNLENCGAFTKGVNFASHTTSHTYKNADGVEVTETVTTPGCGKIKSINLTGSCANSIVLPVGGVLEELRLPTTITTLDIDSHAQLSNGFSLGSFNYDTNKYINDFTHLVHVRIKDTPIDSYNLLKSALFTNATTNLNTYRVEGFNWVLDQEDDFVIANDAVTAIRVLDGLDSRNPQEGYTQEAALVGNIEINIGGVTIDEYTIYHKYLAMYPNVTITYGDNATGLVPAQEIKFYRADAALLDASTDIDNLEHYYYTLSNKSKTLAKLIENTDFSNPIKSPDNDNTYRFSGVWIDWGTKQKYYQQALLQEGVDITGAIEFNDEKAIPQKDMWLVPYYIADTRYYTVTFYDDDTNNTVIDTITGTYNMNVGALAAQKPGLNFLYKDDSALEDDQRYRFLGWISEKDHDEGTTNPQIYDLNEISLTKSMKFYARYGIENARQVASDINLFTVSSGRISIKDEYRDVVRGKITIPSYSASGQELTTLGDFADMPNVTGIYFLIDAKYTTVGSECFKNNMAIMIDLPNTITTIGSYAFNGAMNLTTINLSNNITSIGNDAFRPLDASTELKVVITKLPDSLTTLGDRAFYRCGPNVTISTLPAGLNVIPDQCFMLTPNVAITDFPTREGTCSIGLQAFWGCGQVADADKITIRSPWTLSASATGIDNETNSIAPDGYPYVTTVEIYPGIAENFEKRFFGEDRANVTISVPQ